MTHYIHHEPCPRCGSKDNLARYSDGGAWCFGCGYLERPNVSPYLAEKQEKHWHLPHDCNKEFGKEAIEWISKYNISVEEILPHCLWSESNKQLLFILYDFQKDQSIERDERKTTEGFVYQARNFKFKQKYSNYGEMEDIIHVYRRREGSVECIFGELLCITEDCLSAIKCSSFCDSTPALTSTLSKHKIRRLSQAYRKIIVFLDGDMYHKAQKIADAFTYLGCNASVVYSNKDPKEHDNLGEILAKI